MEFAYISMGKLNTNMMKIIKEVVNNCNICNHNARSKYKSAVAIPRASNFKLIKGMVLNKKLPKSVIRRLYNGWCQNIRFPTVGLYADNGGEFSNNKVDEFTNKLGLDIKFHPAYSPWSK